MTAYQIGLHQIRQWVSDILLAAGTTKRVVVSVVTRRADYLSSALLRLPLSEISWSRILPRVAKSNN